MIIVQGVRQDNGPTVFHSKFVATFKLLENFPRLPIQVFLNREMDKGNISSENLMFGGEDGREIIYTSITLEFDIENYFLLAVKSPPIISAAGSS